jgi:hypothetical protein
MNMSPALISLGCSGVILTNVPPAEPRSWIRYSPAAAEGEGWCVTEKCERETVASVNCVGLG